MHGELSEHFLVSMLVAPDDKNSSANILVVSIFHTFQIEFSFSCLSFSILFSFFTFFHFVMLFMTISQVDQLILALPSREYYLKESSKSDLMAYHNYMTKIAMILGADPATVAEDMQEVLDFEILLANVRIAFF